MRDAGAPTPAFEIFDDADTAREYVRSQGAPIVVKADGLAAGKGVVVAQSVEEALDAVDDAMVNRAFGASGERLVIEQCLTGQELSVFCFTDGEYVSPLVPACDYKRVFDDDQGPNTGGMGGYSPPPWWDAAMEQQIRETCVEPVIREMATPGVARSPASSTAGSCSRTSGPCIIEFNARLGDPEDAAHPPTPGERPLGCGRGVAGRDTLPSLGPALERRLLRRRRVRHLTATLARMRPASISKGLAEAGAECGRLPRGYWLCNE